VRRAAAGVPDAFEQAAFSDAVDKISRSLERVSNVRRCLSTVKRQAELADPELSELVSEIRAALADLKEIAANAASG
jgi:hypothetical protein